MADDTNHLLATPTTGVDTSLYPKFGALPGQGQPQVNPLTQLSQTLGVAGQAQGLQQQQATQGMNAMQYMHGQFGALMSKVDEQGRPNATFDDVANAAANMVRNKVAPAAEIAAQLSSVPRDSAGIQEWARMHQMNIADHAQRISATYGIPSTINLGDKMLSGTVDQRTGAFTQAGQPQTMGMTPEANAARVNGVAGGVPFSAPQSSFVDRRGYALPQPGVPQAGGGPGTMAPRGMGSQVVPNNNPQATPVPIGQPVPQPAPASQAMGLPPGAVQSQQGPGVDATANAQAVANQGRAAALQEAASRAPDTKAILDRMDMHAAAFTGGPASPLLKKFGGYINQAAGAAGLQPPISSQAAREAFDKDAALLAGQQSSQLGGTDAARALASVMTPGASNSNEGIRNIAAVLRGNEDAKSAKAQAWDRYRSAFPAGQADFGHFETQFNQSFSPRAFGMIYMSPAERQKTWNSMSKAEQSQVEKSYNAARAQGFIQAPGSTAPEPPR